MKKYMRAEEASLGGFEQGSAEKTSARATMFMTTPTKMVYSLGDGDFVLCFISRAQGPTIFYAAQTRKDSDLICKDSRFRLTVNNNFC